MKKIGLLADTHGWLDEKIVKALENCDEIWHAGDFGTIAIADELKRRTGVPLRGVYGNIDGQDIRSIYPESTGFTLETLPVFMQHIGGYPGKYAPGVKKKIQAAGAKLFISGHSHILKIQFDSALQCLHINPGAAGQQGWHTMRTLVTFCIDGDQLTNCQVIEMGPRGR
ncbi:MAG: metallophosphatase family protein [Bacteroidetes bacterium]|nr:metallophosphatase family protein [Bacteroidota bacterium]